MKPFNLQEALLGKPFITRKGLEVTEFYLFKTLGSSSRFCCVVDGQLRQYYTNGRYFSVEDTQWDLFMKDSKRWVNVYFNNKKGIYGSPLCNTYSTKEEAIKAIEPIEEYKETIEITTEI